MSPPSLGYISNNRKKKNRRSGRKEKVEKANSSGETTGVRQTGAREKVILTAAGEVD